MICSACAVEPVCANNPIEMRLAKAAESTMNLYVFIRKRHSTVLSFLIRQTLIQALLHYDQ